VVQQRIDPQFVYQTIREEILDQKRCQFQLLSLSVTVTAAIVAYGTGATAAAPVYLAALVMNAVASVIIFDKAISIQRKVGYLQLMEEDLQKYDWKWESQLDEFRKALHSSGSVSGGASSEDPPRKHSYVTTVGWMLLILNAVCVLLFIAAPGAWKWHVENFPWLSLGSGGIVLTVFVAGATAFRIKRSQLIGGQHSGPQIRSTWTRVLHKTIAETSRGTKLLFREPGAGGGAEVIK
jgi:hypothetical protein